MAIAVATTRQLLADEYGLAGTFIGACTGDPGTTNTPANEATGGTPAYTRLATTWTSATGGTINGSPVSLDVPPDTYDHVLLATTAAGADMIDKCAVTAVVMSAQGQIVVTPSFVQT